MKSILITVWYSASEVFVHLPCPSSNLVYRSLESTLVLVPCLFLIWINGFIRLCNRMTSIKYQQGIFRTCTLIQHTSAYESQSWGRTSVHVLLYFSDPSDNMAVKSTVIPFWLIYSMPKLNTVKRAPVRLLQIWVKLSEILVSEESS